MKNIPELETERLILRRAYSSDLPLYEALSDPEVSKYECWYPHTRYEDTMAFINRLMAKYEGRVCTDWVIEYKEDMFPVGMINLHDFSVQHRHAEMGFWLCRRYWHMGIATEAAKAVMNCASSYYELERLQCLCAVQNNASIALLERLGFVYEGLLHRYMYLNCSTEPSDVVIYSNFLKTDKK